MRTLIRVTSIGAAVAVLAVASAGAAVAAHGHGRLGGRLGGPGGGLGPGGLAGGGFGFGARPGLGGRGMGGPGMGPGGPGGAGVLGADVLTPAADFLGISAATLESDLAGGKTLAQEATANGKTAADLVTALVASEKAVLDADKAAGWITADQESRALSQITRALTQLVNNGPPVPPSGKKGGPAGLLQTAATYLGISASDLRSDLKGGKSLADVVASVGNGKTVDGLVTALEAPAKGNLDKAVTAGKLTQAQETAALAKMTTSLTNLVNHTKPTTTKMNTLQKSIKRFATLKKFAKLRLR